MRGHVLGGIADEGYVCDQFFCPGGEALSLLHEFYVFSDTFFAVEFLLLHLVQVVSDHVAVDDALPLEGVGDDC